MKHSGTLNPSLIKVFFELMRFMALELIVLQGAFFLILLCFALAHFSDLKIFWVIGFFGLALIGFFTLTNDGVVIDHYYDSDAVYQSVVLSSSSLEVFVFSQLCLWAGLVLTVWSVAFSSMIIPEKTSKKTFIWG